MPKEIHKLRLEQQRKQIEANFAAIQQAYEKVLEDLRSRATEEVDDLRESVAERLGDLEEQTTMTLALSGRVTPAEFAELLTSLDTIHKELAGYPLYDLVAKIGLPEQTAAHSVS